MPRTNYIWSFWYNFLDLISSPPETIVFNKLPSIQILFLSSIWISDEKANLELAIMNNIRPLVVYGQYKRDISLPLSQIKFSRVLVKMGISKIKNGTKFYYVTEWI